MAANSAEHAPSATKCYSAVLRRLLCSGSLPTHPSDPKADNSLEILLPADENAKPQGGSSNPGVVARLMGLDSFPNSPPTQHDRTLGSFFRSRSTNSIDFVTHFDPVKQHRRVRTSVSFREGMYYHDCMGKVDEAAGEKRNNKEKRGGSGNSGKLREKNAIKKREGYLNERRPVLTKKNKNKKKAVKAKEETTPTTTKVLKKRQSKSFGCKVHPQGIAAPASAGPASKTLRTKCADVEGGGVSPRRASPSKIGRPCSVKRGKKGKRSSMKRDNYKESCYYKRMVEVICGLTDESVISEKWIYHENEICNEFGQEILQVLLKQFVDELLQPTL